MCSCDYDDGDGFPRVWDVSFPRAARPYRCDECFQPIATGERYKRIGAFYEESGWENFSLCGKCVRVRAAHKAADPHCNPPFEELRECIREAVKDKPGYLAKFRAAWKAMAA
jgi:hypothetical protein